MKRTLSAGIPLKIFAVLSIFALVLLLAPMLKASQYDVPSADDYVNGLNTHLVWQETGSVIRVLVTALDWMRNVYLEWQGTYSAVFLFALNPMVFDEQLYPVGAWVSLGTLICGIFTLTFTVMRRLFQAGKAECGILAVIATVICTQFLPRVSQGIYWYTGAIYYTFFFGLAAIAFSLLLCYIFRKTGDRGIGKLTAAALLFLFIGGGNLVTCLTSAVLLLSMEVLLILLKRPDRKTMLIPLIIFFAGFALNAAAPGNGKRQLYFEQPGLFRAVLLSFQQAGVFFLKWFTLPVIVLILMTIPVLWRIASRTYFRFPLPGLVSIYSVCLAGVMFYPPIYAMTDHNLQNLGRITNIIFFGEVLLVIFNLFYWMGWLCRKGILTQKLFPSGEKGRYSCVFLVVMLLVFAFGMTQIKWFDTTSISAFRSYRSGEMGNYWHTYKQRLEILKDPEIKDAVLKRFPYRPYVLFFNEMSEYPEENTTVAAYYGKDTVVIR